MISSLAPYIGHVSNLPPQRGSRPTPPTPPPSFSYAPGRALSDVPAYRGLSDVHVPGRRGLSGVDWNQLVSMCEVRTGSDGRRHERDQEDPRGRGVRGRGVRGVWSGRESPRGG